MNEAPSTPDLPARSFAERETQCWACGGWKTEMVGGRPQCVKCGCRKSDKTSVIDTQPPTPDLPARYHAALDEIEAKSKATGRAIRDLLREFEQSTGAEVKGLDIQRRWPDHQPSYLEFVTLKLEAMPMGRRVWGKGGSS